MLTDIKGYINRYTTLAAVLGALIVVGLVVLLIGITTPAFSSKVERTGPNTWHISDPDNKPYRHINQTCATEGKKVIQLQQPPQGYDELNVVCSS